MISNHQKNTPDTFKEAMSCLYNFMDINNKHSPLIGDEFWTRVSMFENEHHPRRLLGFDLITLLLDSDQYQQS